MLTLILFLAIGLLPVFVHEFRNNNRLMLAYLFVIALHQAVAFTNVYLFGTPGATGDALHFHEEGGKLAESADFFFTTGARLYYNMLGVVYWLFGTSKILGAQFSILAFAISCIVLIKILRLLELSHYRVPILLVFGALPAMVFFGSVTLRESYQILYFMLAVYFGLLMSMKKGVNVYFLLMLVAVLLMGLLHLGLIVYAVFMVVLFMVWTPYPSSNLLSIKIRKLMIGFAMLATLAAVILLANAEIIHLGALSRLPEKDLFEQISHHRLAFEDREQTRAAYIVATDFSSPFATVNTFFTIYVQYLFAPFPWQIKNILDVYASMETIFRMVLIYYSVKHWHNAYGVQRRLLGLMLILFFSMSFMWSIGTSNYGTGIRHHLLDWWILSIVGIPMLMRTLSRFRLS